MSGTFFGSWDAISDIDTLTDIDELQGPGVPGMPVVTPVLNPTDEDFQIGFMNLLPTGAVWPRDSDSVIAQVSLSLVKEYTRNAAAAANLLTDAMPIAPVMMLPEWEASLGLPDPCAGASPTIQQRQQQVNARFTASGGQTPAYFISLAASLGYTVTITQFSPFRVGINTVGQPLYGTAWAYAWQVNAPQFTIEYFAVDRDAVGEPLASWGNTVLQCELKRVAPAHTVLIFNYAS